VSARSGWCWRPRASIRPSSPRSPRSRASWGSGRRRRCASGCAGPRSIPGGGPGSRARSRSRSGAQAGERRAASGERDPQERVGFLRGGARPPTPVLIDYIAAHRDEFGVEPICRVLTEHGCPIAPSTSAYGLDSRDPRSGRRHAPGCVRSRRRAWHIRRSPTSPSGRPSRRRNLARIGNAARVRVRRLEA
jgi:hypothetical protein